MRFHRLAFSTAAVLALSAFQGFNNHALAEEVESTPIEITPESSAPVGEQYEFQAEVSRILDIVVNSLYQNKDVFLRELISNASDALDKIRFVGITKPELMADQPELEVRVQYDLEAKTLTVTDTGIGMTKDELIANLGTVANSGTTKFMEGLADGAADVSQIGMFGVGFYSAFLVADKVSVATKSPLSDTQYIWNSSNGASSFSIAEDPRGNSLKRGTEITLFLKDDAEEYALYEKLSGMVHHYSEFITHPIFVRKTETMQVPEEDEEDSLDEMAEDDELDVGDEEDASTEEEKTPKYKDVTTHSWIRGNADAAIWNRNKEEILDEEYQNFYKLINKEAYKNATSWSHFDAEGNINFKSLVYLPEDVPRSMANGGDVTKFNNKMKLYVRKVLISDEFELLPSYMSFITGVVDSDDLPLNVNRETLQESKIIAVIRKKTTRKVIDMIKKLADQPHEEEEEDADAEIDADGNVIVNDEEEKKEKKVHPYIEWYQKFQPSLKMGVIEDESNRKRLAKLIRFKTSKSGEDWVSFEDYVSNMKDWQNSIYFLSGNDLSEMEKSPFMEKFNKKDVEVIYFTQPADEYMVSHMREFDSKKITTITHESIKFDDEDEDLNKRIEKAYKAKYEPLTKFMSKFYGKAVSKIKISQRLESAPAIASSGEYGNTANMERLMQAQAFSHGDHNPLMFGAKTLEINPRHPFIDNLLDKIPEGEEKPPIEIRDALWNLLDTALLNGGYNVREGKAFNMRMMRSIKNGLGVENVDLLEEIEPAVEEDVPPPFPEANAGMNMEDFADFDSIDIDGSMPEGAEAL
mmetsp:Transcript_17133/g.24932  ORF Transcript_17133/g.24932 Transcript_17133/m.24932 type:complete len:808 (-) Transcript_17133:199-2622(-)|eukprot:CAMPEP_0197239144 /NCGR_PEP_ID=MMETSP1429-20130617/5654_1 /TAXON_ID=49237 /ORGANISM="Chaetoceros  sp., Strain UNC1202" /LENGTH=807 /DNA_ID=CAMNT_0042698501 /DNA_START=34 /DNA_END=2457 /DNA_ORIENTATION=-